MKLALISYKLALWLIFTALTTSCMEQKENSNPLKKILAENRDELSPVIDNLNKHRVQILYTQIDRKADNSPVFTSHGYRLNEQEYFYPASSIKLPIAVLAMEKLNELNIDELSINTTMLTDSAYTGQTSVRYDSSAANNLPSVGHYIKKLFLVSDNDAYNRLYEFCGQAYLNEQLAEKGYNATRILTRLAIPLSFEANRHTNPVRFVDGDRVIYQQPLTYNPDDQAFPEPVNLGKGEIVNDRLVQEPKDFSHKNRTSVQDLHNMMKAIIFPDEAGKSGFNLSGKDHQFLYKYMSGYPGTFEHPAYDTSHYTDSYVKFFMFGDQQQPIPEHIRIFNKVGYAYGFLIDNAYIIDLKNKVEFLLTAVVFVNENEIFNDGNYEYDSIGLPFMANLGTAIYNYELERKRKHQPDLSRFVINYE